MDNLDITDEMLYKSCKKLEQHLLDNLPNESDIEYEFSNKFAPRNLYPIINKVLNSVVY